MNKKFITAKLVWLTLRKKQPSLNLPYRIVDLTTPGKYGARFTPYESIKKQRVFDHIILI